MTNLIAVIVSLLVGVGGTYYLYAKKVFKAAKEVADVLYKVENAFADDQLTKEEVEEIYVEGKEAIEAIKAIGKKG